MIMSHTGQFRFIRAEDLWLTWTNGRGEAVSCQRQMRCISYRRETEFSRIYQDRWTPIGTRCSPTKQPQIDSITRRSHSFRIFPWFRPNGFSLALPAAHRSRRSRRWSGKCTTAPSLSSRRTPNSTARMKRRSPARTINEEHARTIFAKRRNHQKRWIIDGTVLIESGQKLDHIIHLEHNKTAYGACAHKTRSKSQLCLVLVPHDHPHHVDVNEE